MQHTHRCLWLTASLALPAAAIAQQATFTRIAPSPSRATAQVLCLSADGQTAGGQCSGGFLTEATLWTGGSAANAIVPGDYISPPINSINGLSDDGAWAAGTVGRILIGEAGPYALGTAARWSESFGWELLDPSYTLESSVALSASADGSVLVGYGRPVAADPVSTAFTWSAEGGFTQLPPFTAALPHRLAFDVSADGTVISGAAQTPDAAEEAVLWENGVMRRLGFIAASGPRQSVATCITADGTLAAGSSTNNASRNEATLFTANGPIGLGILTAGGGGGGPAPRSTANGLSDDAAIVVGQSGTPEQRIATIWDPVNGTRNLATVAAALPGVDLTGWTLTDARGITPDGTTIVGNGIYQGVFNGFRLQVPCFVAPRILASPAPQTIASGSTATFTARATRHGAVTGQWLRAGSPVNLADPRITVATVNGISTLTITAIASSDSGAYTFAASNACGTATSNPALLSIGVVCGPSDVAGANQAVGSDGALTADDIIVFLGWFFAGDSRADVAGANQSTVPDNAFTADDIIVFLGRYFAGC